MKGVAVILFVVIGSGLLYFLLLAGGPEPQAPGGSTAPAAESEDAIPALTIFREVRADRLVGSTPVNNALVDRVPEQASVSFSFVLDLASAITVSHGGEVLAAPTQFTQDGLTMFADLRAFSDPGPYLVTYDACVAPDRCTSGRFGFTVR